MKRILVTGGAGFIGTHTCLSLLNNNYEIIVYDSFINSNKKSLKRVVDIANKINPDKKKFIQIVIGDIRDEEKLRNVFLEAQLLKKPIEAVIHFAGLKSVSESVLDPLLYWDVNVNGSIKLFKIMSQFNCRTIVFSSSATIYGFANNNPINEKQPIKPINSYGDTKYSIETILKNLNKSIPNKWRIANLRYFNPVSAHSSGLIGESPNGVPNNIFPYLTQVASGLRPKLNIFGNDWPTPDGTGVRDYIHVMDLAEGHLKTLEYLMSNMPQIINLNLGNGVGISVLELINKFEEVNKIKIPYVFTNRRPGDVGIVIADNSYALSLLNWSPRRTLEEMCEDGWNWQRKNPNGY